MVLASAKPGAKQSPFINNGDLLTPVVQWNSLPKEAGEIREQPISNNDDLNEGSGDDEDDEGDDYLDESLRPSGSRYGQWDLDKQSNLKLEKTATNGVVKPENKAMVDSFHFKGDSNSRQSAGVEESDPLYEYYNDYYDEHDYQEDGIALNTDEYNDSNGLDFKFVSPTFGSEDKSLQGDLNYPGKKIREKVPLPFFRGSYLYVMLVSAVISFTVAMGLFLLCRCSAMAGKQKKKGTGLFLVSDRHMAASPRPSPIVKSYQKVPTSAREYLDLPGPPVHYSPALDPIPPVGQSKKPLLT